MLNAWMWKRRDTYNRSGMRLLFRCRISLHRHDSCAETFKISVAVGASLNFTRTKARLANTQRYNQYAFDFVTLSRRNCFTRFCLGSIGPVTMRRHHHGCFLLLQKLGSVALGLGPLDLLTVPGYQLYKALMDA